MTKKTRGKAAERVPPGGEGAEPVKMKRLTIDVSAVLHSRIKVACAQRGTIMADEIRALLEQHYGS